MKKSNKKQENIDDRKFIVVNGDKIPIVDDDNKDGLIPFVTKGMLSKLKKIQEEQDIKMANLIFSGTTGDKSITDPLVNKDKQEEEIMNTVLKDLYKCNENVSGIWKLVSDNELGDRNNKGKLRWSLVDMKTLEGLVKVLMMGAEKYSDFNWQKGLPINEVYESLMRHLVSFMDGEDNDTESGLSHLDHALCNIYFMKWFMDNKPEMDNRRKKKVEIKEQDFVEPKYPDENEK